MKKLYWDTSVFLCFLNPREEMRRNICEDILQCAKKKEVEIYTSTFTIAEVIRPKRIKDARRLTAAEIARIEQMFKWSFVKKIDVDQRVGFKAVALARDFNLFPADSVHAASAILKRVDVLQYWDRDFSAVKDLIAVEEPTWITCFPNQFDSTAGDWSEAGRFSELGLDHQAH